MKIKALAVIGLLALFAALTINSSVRESATYDEVSHLPAGYAAVAWGDYRLNPEHPPLIKMFCALPLLAMKVWPPTPEFADTELAGRYRPTSLRALKEAYALALADNGLQWYFGKLFFYALRTETLVEHNIALPLTPPTTLSVTRTDFFNDTDRLLFWARLPVTVLGVLLGLVIFSWARDLWGVAGGFLALALFCFDPNFIAHAGLVTTDVGLSLFLAGTLYFFWRHCRQPSWRDATLAMLCCAAAFAAKYSAVVMLPMLVLVGAWHVWRRRTDAWRIGGFIVLLLLTSWAGIWAVHGFRYSAATDPQRAAEVERRLTGDGTGHFRLERVLRDSTATKALLKSFPDGPPSDQVATLAPNIALGVTDRLMLFAAQHQLLPESYLFGFAWVQFKSHVRSSFLNGQYSATGFWDYFLWSFLWKTPLLTIGLVVAGLVVLVRRWRADAVWLLVPPLIYLAVSMTSNLNIGHRHLLPIYPFLFVLAGSLTLVWKRWRPATRYWTAALAGAGMLWAAGTGFPHHLAYFNELAGGPRGGIEKLVDSNLDWGQDLKKLRRWLDQRGVGEPIALCYFGTADPLYHGIQYVNLPGGYPFAAPGPVPTRGYLAVSATNLKGAYYSAEGKAFLRGLLQRATLVDTVGYSIYIYQLN